jgi:uncharacterized peroxidase-related enzyme
VTLPLPDDSTNPGIAAEYAAARTREGAVLAILRALGPRPEVVRAFLAQAEAALYGPATLARRERELLAVATSRANGADYSTDAHSSLLDELGGGPDGSPRDRALVAFAERLTLSPRESAEAVSDLRAWCSVEEIYDAIAVVGLLNHANRAALAAGITADDDLR